MVETEGLEAFLALDVDAARPPATVAAPPTVPDIDGTLLPTVFRGAALSDLPQREALTAVTAPTLVLAWVDDPGHPLSTAESIASLLPNSELRVASSPEDLAGWPSALLEQVRSTHPSHGAHGPAQ